MLLKGSLLMAFLSSTTRAFSRSSSSSRRVLTVVPFGVNVAGSPAAAAAAVTSCSTARLMSTFGGSGGGGGGPMPYPDAKMPFYALGVNLALQIGQQANIKTLLEDDEIDIVLEAFCDHVRGTSANDARAILVKYGQDLNKILSGRNDKLVDRIKADGADFISNFKDCNPEATETASGLVYLPMKEGSGKQPTVQNTVEVHYHGTLPDGTVFDSSVDRGQTISFSLGAVIKGWQEGLQLMKEGGKATMLCPSDIAYGDQGSGDVIPPGATLKFEVELFKVS